MSKKKPAANNKASLIDVTEVLSPVKKNAFNLSFPTNNIGWHLHNDGYVIAKDIFDLLFDRFDEEMVRQRINHEYKSYAIKNQL